MLRRPRPGVQASRRVAAREPLPIYVASYNTSLHTELCIRSLHHYAGGPFTLNIGDSDSRDGSAEMLNRLAQEGWLTVESIQAPRLHREWLDHWLQNATAERVLFCDSDIEFLRSGFIAALRATRAAIVSPELLAAGRYVDSKLTTHLMTRPAPWLTMIDAPSLRSLQTSFAEVTEATEEYPEGKRTFDVGGLLYHRALEAGLTYADLGRSFRRYYRHYFGASWRTVGPIGRLRRDPAKLLERSLEKLRATQPAPSDLHLA